MKNNEINTTPATPTEYAQGLSPEERDILDGIKGREADRAARLARLAEATYTVDGSGNVMLPEEVTAAASQHEMR